jgi:probable HAF family extracellular repeat protein
MRQPQKKSSGWRLRSSIYLACFLLAKVSSLCAQSEFKFYDLGSFVIPNAINNSAVVVGQKYDSPLQITSRAFMYSNGVMTNLASLGGGNSAAYGINDAGVIVGQSDLTNGNHHAFSYQNGIITDLGTLGGPNSSAIAINQAGTIVGQSDIKGGNYHAFCYSNGVMTDLGTADNFFWSSARAINNRGTIVGQSWYDPSTSPPRAFCYSNGTMSTLSQNEMYVQGINDSNVITGYLLYANSSYHIFTIADGITNDLGGGYAFGINIFGEVVGGAQAYYYKNGIRADISIYLPTVGLSVYSVANAVNDEGDIVGAEVAPDRTNLGFLLKKLPTAINVATPILSNGVVHLGFNLSSGAANSFSLLTSEQPNGNWTTDTDAVLITNTPGVSYSFRVPLSRDNARFFKVRSP